MLKSDSWIAQQCLPPKFVVTKNLITSGGPSITDVRVQEVQSLSSQSAEELRGLVATWVQTRQTLLSDYVGGIKSFREATAEDLRNWRPMISPYVAGQVREKVTELPLITERQRVISYGTSSYGYDVRLDRKFKIFTNVFNGIIDPLKADPKIFVDHEGDTCVIPPNSYILGHTIETFVMPRDVTAICLGKSTYARCGAIVNVTPIEAGFEGQVVIEISNATPLPLVVHANQGIAQFLFFQSDEPCKTSYADRAGKYQGQQGLQTALV